MPSDRRKRDALANKGIKKKDKKDGEKDMPKQTEENKKNKGGRPTKEEIKKRNEKRGRPKAVTAEKRKLLEDGARYGLTAERLSLYADIPYSTMTDYFRKNPDFLARIRELQNSPRLNAEMNIAESIADNNIDTTRWYLERRAKEDYSTKTVTESAVRVDLPLSDKEQALSDFVRGFLGSATTGDHKTE